MPRQTKYELISTKGDRVEFGYEQALTLLTKFKTWSLPEDSKYELVDNDIRRKSDKSDSE